MMIEEPVAINIPRRVVNDVEQRLPYTRFESVDEYVTFAMEQILRAAEEPDAETESVDSEDIRKQLESLGYLAE